MEFKISKEQIDELARMNAVIKERLNEYFPEAFKKELEVGRWYKHNSTEALICYQGNEKSYGISNWGHWSNGYYAANALLWREATTEEIESALINEAKKKGYKKGNFKCLVERECEFNKNTHEWSFQQNGLFTAPFGKGGSCLFQDGIWAEILPTEKTVITRQKALKILAKKLKVSPENIEIE